MRGADGGPWRRLCALPAFWVPSCPLGSCELHPAFPHLVEV